MAASTHAIKRAILATVQRAGSASPKQIAEALGPDWLEPGGNARFRMMLGRMTGPLLVNEAHGRYRLAGLAGMRQIDNGADTEDRILAFLRKRGGVVRTKEIHLAIAGEAPTASRRTTGNRDITNTLKRSPHFQQDFGYGYWNLTPDELDKLPLLGRWANYQIAVDWGFGRRPEGFDTWQQVRADLFSRVGEAFTDARGDLDVLDVAAQPDIAAILNAMTIKAPAVRAEVLEQMRVEVQAETGLDGYDLNVAMMERSPTQLPAYILIAFERGAVELHLAAPAELYRLCGAMYGVCPAAMSRGDVVSVSPSP